MMINHIMCTSKILTDLCFTKQNIKIKDTFANVVYSVLVVNRFWTIIKKIVRGLMTHNLQNYKKEQMNLEISSNKY